MSQLLPGPSPEVAAESQAGLLAEREGPRPTPLPEDVSDVVLEVEICHGQAGDLGQPSAGVQKQPHDRRVPAIDVGVALGSREEGAELDLGEDRDGLLGDDGRLHAFHGGPVDLLLVELPFHQLLQRPVNDVRSRRGPGLHEVADVGSDVPSGQLLGAWQIAAFLLQEVDQALGGTAVDPLRAVSADRAPQVAHEVPDDGALVFSYEEKQPLFGRCAQAGHDGRPRNPQVTSGMRARQ